MEKKDLRKQIVKCRDTVSTDQLEIKSNIIKELLFARQEFKQAQTIMFFLTFGSEVRTEAMIREAMSLGKRIIVPKTDTKNRVMILSELEDYDEDLEPGVWDIPEPKNECLRPIVPQEIDLVISPGVGFDEEGNRLGYGGGYYDRFFRTLREDVPLEAIAFECQMTEQVPVMEWDRKMDVLITEKMVRDFK